MFLLCRTVRFAIGPGGSRGPTSAHGPNGYSGVPAIQGLGRHYELDVRCRGHLDPVIGYLVNIKDVDVAVRTAAIPAIAEAAADLDAEPAPVLRRFFPLVDAQLAGCVSSLRWWLTPYHSIEMLKDRSSTVLLRQRFEFAASHRLHSPQLSEEENRRVYGKCNHPSGHGHNYIVEPCVITPVSGASPRPLALGELERIVTSVLIDRFDHKHLNIDIPEFGPQGLNPSVENIAKVSFELLRPAIAATGSELRDITVWETEKTSCTYPV